MRSMRCLRHESDAVPTALTAVDIIVTKHAQMSTHDGIRLATDIYRPTTRDPVPVLLHRTPYGKDITLATDFVGLAAAGFAVVVQDVRGRFASEGIFRPFQQEPDDGVDAIEWAANQPWSSGNVGMFGTSYTTEPLSHALEVIGPIELRLFVSSSAIDTDFTGKLVDVHPSGRAEILCDGVLRAAFVTHSPCRLPWCLEKSSSSVSS
jgi:predicted acyl esterase